MTSENNVQGYLIFSPGGPDVPKGIEVFSSTTEFFDLIDRHDESVDCIVLKNKSETMESCGDRTVSIFNLMEEPLEAREVVAPKLERMCEQIENLTYKEYSFLLTKINGLQRRCQR